MASARLFDYLGSGLAADRPATVDIPANGLALYYSTDSIAFEMWDGTAWVDIPLGAIPTLLSDLLDVDTTGITDGQILRWDAGTSQWLPNDEQATLTDAPNDGTRYVRLNGAWVADLTYLADAASDGTYYVRRNGAWVAMPAGGIADVPTDGVNYIRKDGAWVALPAYPTPGIADAPSNGTKYVRQNAAWVPDSVSTQPWWFAPPLAADFPIVGSYDAVMPTVSDTVNSGLLLRWTGNYVTADSSKGCFRALPAGVDWEIKTRFQLTCFDTNFHYGGIAIRQSVQNRALTIAQTSFASAGAHFFLGQLGWVGQGITNTTLTIGTFRKDIHFWVKWTQATLTLSVYASVDGEVWLRVGRHIGAAWFGGVAPDQIGFKIHTAAAMTADTEQTPFITVPRWNQSW